MKGFHSFRTKLILTVFPMVAGGQMLACATSSRPHSESADHAALRLSVLWDIWESIDAEHEGYFFGLGAG